MMKVDEYDMNYRDIKHFISYCDESNSILIIANLCGFSFFEAYDH